MIPQNAALAGSLTSEVQIAAEASYIRPINAHHIDAPLPETTASDQIVGIYGNILYPQDKERLQQLKLLNWVEDYSTDPSTPFPISPEDINDISLFILDRIPTKAINQFFYARVNAHLSSGHFLEGALENAKQEILERANLYKEIAQNIPAWEGRNEILIEQFRECSAQLEQIIDRKITVIKNESNETVQRLLDKKSNDLIESPFTWDMRVEVFKQMIDKVISVSPNSPYFLALQEVTPQALSDLKRTLADRNLQWISFNNLSAKETLEPRQEEILGEATGFTSTIALSRDLQVLKVELGDLPTESGSIRKILGVRVRNIHTNKSYNLFTTHTDHKIQNDIYARTAVKIHEFATQFFQDVSNANEQRLVIGGDLNAFKQLDGDKYVERLHELFAGSHDFRETDYYAPLPIAWSSFIGHQDDTYSERIARDGIVEPNALDHIIVGGGIELQSAAREAAVYNTSGQLLDYYQERDEYIANLKERITFSDHFFNIVRFK